MTGAIDLRRLRYFVAVCEQGSFSKASEFLNVAQSSLSQHVALLEQDLGVDLLLRRSRGINRTEAGDRLFAHACGLLRAVEQVEMDVRMLATSIAGPVMVGFSYAAMDPLGLPFIKRVRTQCPDIRLRVVEAHSEELRQWMLSGEAGLALTFLAPKDDSVDVTPLLDEDLVCIGTKALLKHTAAISFEEVLSLPLIMPGRPSVLRTLVADNSARRRLIERTVLEVEGVTALKRTVIAGLGCSVQSAAIAARDLVDGTLIARPIVGPALTRSLYLVSSRSRTASRAVMETRRLLLETLRDAYRRGLWPSVLHTVS